MSRKEKWTEVRMGISAQQLTLSFRENRKLVVPESDLAFRQCTESLKIELHKNTNFGAMPIINCTQKSAQSVILLEFNNCSVLWQLGY